ncbi:hypothetical protein GCM10010912_35320 [Paenibacillus albidus]|uniref:Uncharacterized protein n=1 Tax=Paenibacillus albidus TaxID=2041023 RepID=A0A917CFM6_9BACL|nr:hypothetical protein GCM10010912_35320 [Paenibacillus albidus]
MLCEATKPYLLVQIPLFKGIIGHNKIRRTDPIRGNEIGLTANAGKGVFHMLYYPDGLGANQPSATILGHCDESCKYGRQDIPDGNFFTAAMSTYNI